LLETKKGPQLKSPTVPQNISPPRQYGTKMKRRSEGRREWREWVPGTSLGAKHL